MWSQAGVSNVLLAIQACDTAHSLFFLSNSPPHHTLLGLPSQHLKVPENHLLCYTFSIVQRETFLFFLKSAHR